MDPVIWFFALGLFAGLARSDLRIPPAVYELLSTLLLLTIGLKGGVELARMPFSGLGFQVVAVLAMGFVLPLFLYPIARGLGRFGRADAGSLAAHWLRTAACLISAAGAEGWSSSFSVHYR